MNRFHINKILVGGALALSLACPAAAAQVEINGVMLEAHEGWIENGASYVTLMALSREVGYELSWDGTSASLEYGQTSLTARPWGPLYRGEWPGPVCT